MAVLRQPRFSSIIFSLVYLLLLVAPVTAQDCSASNPCPDACCSTAGFCGLGPDYCGTGNCTANCDRKAECNPGWSDPSFATSQTCPLNVCCSKYGHCGTTKDFCGNKTVKRPSCGKKSHMTRVVGYYEGWSTYTRSCDKFWPEQIPTGAYSHINFAFASVDPQSFHIVPADNRDKQLYARVTSLKRKDPNLQVFISIGGWAFNDPGPTRPIFGELAADETKQKAFFKSLVSFLSTYNFDGVDLDWEYPAADDRGGTAADYKNFPTFMKNLKAALKSSGRDGLSITLPASFWYLQHFDLVNLAKHVDWFNIMSYDLHGTWDQGNKWVGPYLNAHTNLTEITDALDLLWRNRVSPSQVVMGIAFYGRSFTATSKSCLDPGCNYLSGGDAGDCSKTIGVLLNSEINSTISKRSLKPKLNKKAAVKIATWEDQWVAYDDPDTFQLKVDFARGECLSGVMVWAVSHDTKDAFYSTALASIVGRPVALEDNDATPFTTVSKSIGQCYWTNCNEECPSGWHTISRDDNGARENELMVDEGGCNDIGLHTLCCPGDQQLPTCGWYGFNNGDCDMGHQCPSGYIEVGSNRKYCNRFGLGYEAACCTTGTTAMGIWDSCSWDPSWPNCPPKNPCSGSQTHGVLQSFTGSGGADCDFEKVGVPSQDYDYSKSGNYLCCDSEESSRDFFVESCQVYDNIGFGPDHGDPCLTGCPSGTIRMGMDLWGGHCLMRGGGQSSCCLYTAQTSFQVENPLVKQYRQAIQDWIQKQTCSNPGKLPVQAIAKRGLGLHSEDGLNFENITARALEARQASAKSSEDVTLMLLYAIITALDGSAMLGAEKDIWDNAMRPTYPALQTRYFIPFMNSWDSLEEQGPFEISHEVLCHPAWYNALSSDFQARGSSHSAITCNYTLCDINGPGPFCSDDDEIEEENDTTGNNDGSGSKFMARQIHRLVKRVGKKRKYKVFVADNEVLETESLTYPQTDDFDEDNEIRDEVYEAEDNTDCLNTDLAFGAAGPSGTNTRIHSEHPGELQMIQDYLNAIGNGELSSGRRMPEGRIDPSFFPVINDRQYLENNPITGAGGFVSDMPAEQLYNCLGSMVNQAPFLLADRDINLMKALLWGLKDPMAYAKINKLVKSGNKADVEKALTAIKKVFLVMKYLRDSKFTDNLLLVLNCVDGVLDAVSTVWNSDRRNTPYNHHNAWRSFIRDHLQTVANRASEWVEFWLVRMQIQYPDRSTPLGAQVQEMIATFFNFLHDETFEIPLRGW